VHYFQTNLLTNKQQASSISNNEPCKTVAGRGTK